MISQALVRHYSPVWTAGQHVVRDVRERAQPQTPLYADHLALLFQVFQERCLDGSHRRLLGAVLSVHLDLQRLQQLSICWLIISPNGQIGFLAHGCTTQWIADLNLDPLSRFDSYMRAKVRKLYISLFHAYARKNNMWILNHGEALLKVDPLQPAQGTGLIHCGRYLARYMYSTGACGYNRPYAHQYVGKYQSCMVQNGR